MLYALAGDLDRLVDLNEARRWSLTHDLQADVVTIGAVTEALAAALERHAAGIWRAEVEADGTVVIVSTGLHLPLLVVAIATDTAVATWGAPGAIVGARRLAHGGLDQVGLDVAAELRRRGRTSTGGLIDSLRTIGYGAVDLIDGGGVGYGQLVVRGPGGPLEVTLDHFGAQWIDPEHGLQRFPLGARQALAELIVASVQRKATIRLEALVQAGK